VIKVIFLLLLISVASTACDAAQLGRVTAEVNFREGPNRSTHSLKRLPAGTEVQVLREGPGDWYQVMHEEQSGFVHKNYIKLYQDQNSDSRLEPKRRQLAMPGGIMVAGIGIILMASVLAPDLLLTAIALLVSLLAVVVFDFWFQLGLVYSLFSISFGVLALGIFFRRKKKG